jgi:hypothetical protein
VCWTVDDMRRGEGKGKGKKNLDQKWARKRSVAKWVGRPTMALTMVIDMKLLYETTQTCQPPLAHHNPIAKLSSQGICTYVHE